MLDPSSTKILIFAGWVEAEKPTSAKGPNPTRQNSNVLLRHPLDGVFEFFAGAEFYSVAGFDFDGLTGLGITAFASLTTDF